MQSSPGSSNSRYPTSIMVDPGNLGTKIRFVFMGTSICLVIDSWFLIHNTSGMISKEVDQLYPHRISVRKFRTHIEEMRLRFYSDIKHEEA